MERGIAGSTGMGNFKMALGSKINKIPKENVFFSVSVALTQMMYNLSHNLLN